MADETVILPGGTQIARNKYQDDSNGYFAHGPSSDGSNSNEYRWVDAAYLSTLSGFDPDLPWLNFVSEKYNPQGQLMLTKGYLWQDPLDLASILNLPAHYRHFTATHISENPATSGTVDVYFLVDDEAAYETWLTDREMEILNVPEGMYHYLHAVVFNRYSGFILTHKRYVRSDPFDPYSESYLDAWGNRRIREETTP